MHPNEILKILEGFNKKIDETRLVCEDAMKILEETKVNVREDILKLNDKINEIFREGYQNREVA